MTQSIDNERDNNFAEKFHECNQNKSAYLFDEKVLIFDEMLLSAIIMCWPTQARNL